MNSSETPRKLSAIKSVSWRLIGVFMLGVITWVITRDLVKVTMITLLHHGAFIVIYYFHERFWERVEAKGKPFWKAFTYEIILGFLVLGIITFAVTGSWKQVTEITVIYLTSRFLLFPAHEMNWNWFYERRYGRREAH